MVNNWSYIIEKKLRTEGECFKEGTTSIDMSERPCTVMQIFCHKLLGRWLHWKILSNIISFSYHKERCTLNVLHRILRYFQTRIETFQVVHTRGGKIFSAARRGTENPPWVLVSLAVRVLQKNSEGCLLCLRPMSDASIASFSYCGTEIQVHMIICTK